MTPTISAAAFIENHTCRHGDTIIPPVSIAATAGSIWGALFCLCNELILCSELFLLNGTVLGATCVSPLTTSSTQSCTVKRFCACRGHRQSRNRHYGHVAPPAREVVLHAWPRRAHRGHGVGDRDGPDELPLAERLIASPAEPLIIMIIIIVI